MEEPSTLINFGVTTVCLNPSENELRFSFCQKSFLRYDARHSGLVWKPLSHVSSPPPNRIVFSTYYEYRKGYHAQESGHDSFENEDPSPATNISRLERHRPSSVSLPSSKTTNTFHLT